MIFYVTRRGDFSTSPPENTSYGTINTEHPRARMHLCRIVDIQNDLPEVVLAYIIRAEEDMQAQLWRHKAKGTALCFMAVALGSLVGTLLYSYILKGILP